LENVLPAVVVAKELGVGTEDIAEVVREFEGLPHRLEFVRELNGVRYYNDSFSTTPDTSMAAVDSFDEPTVLIAGGSEKGADYSEWALKILVKPNLHTVVLIGDTAARMEDALLEAEKQLGEAEGSPTKILRRGDLEEAIMEAYAEASEGGVVVMSPATASFGLFKNYKERGERFKDAVLKLR
jgi:UDP-N-acetylmuramoylalanine--D-glutamate ligase